MKGSEWSSGERGNSLDCATGGVGTHSMTITQVASVDSREIINGSPAPSHTPGSDSDLISAGGMAWGGRRGEVLLRVRQVFEKKQKSQSLDVSHVCICERTMNSKDQVVDGQHNVVAS